MGIYTAMAVIFYKLNLIGTFAGVVLVHIVNTMMFMVWIPSGAFRTVHIQQEESARDVGASPLRTFLMVTLPMAKPGIIVASLYTFLGSMEEAQGSLLIGLPNVHTMPSELYGIIMSFPDTKWETEHTAEWDNAFALMAELHPYLYQTAGKVQYPMKNAGSLDLLATKQIDMTPAFVNMVLSQKNMGTMPESIKLQPIEPAFSGALAGFCIPKIAKDQEAALSVIDYYLSYEAQAIGWNTMYASPVVDTAKLENLDHADWLEETNMDELRYFSIGMIQKDIVVRWAEEIAPLAQ